MISFQNLQENHNRTWRTYSHSDPTRCQKFVFYKTVYELKQGKARERAEGGKTYLDVNILCHKLNLNANSTSTSAANCKNVIIKSREFYATSPFPALLFFAFLVQFHATRKRDEVEWRTK